MSRRLSAFCTLLIAMSLEESSALAQEPPSEPRLMLVADGHTTTIVGVHFRKNDTELVSVCKDGVVVIWDLQTQRPIQKFYLPVVRSMFKSRLSSCGRYLAAVGGGGLNIYDLERQTVSSMGTARYVTHFEFLPDRPELVWSVKDKVRLTNAQTAENIKEWIRPLTFGRFDLSGDGKSAWFEGRELGTKVSDKTQLALLSLSEGDVLHKFPTQKPHDYLSLSVAPKGTHVFGIYRSAVSLNPIQSVVCWSKEGVKKCDIGQAIFAQVLKCEVKGLIFLNDVAALDEKKAAVVWRHAREKGDEQAGASHAWGICTLTVNGAIETGWRGEGVLERPVMELNGRRTLAALAGAMDRSIHIVDLKTWQPLAKLRSSSESEGFHINRIGWRHDLGAFCYTSNASAKVKMIQVSSPKLKSPLDKEKVDLEPLLSHQGFSLKQFNDHWHLYRTGVEVSLGKRDQGHLLMTLVPKTPLLLMGTPWGTLYFFDTTREKFGYYSFNSTEGRGNLTALAATENNRFFLAASTHNVIRVYRGADLKKSSSVVPVMSPSSGPRPVVSIFVGPQQEWIAWTPQGYYAASPGGERLMGWVIENGADKFATYHDAGRFRNSLHRPDIIAKFFEIGDMDAAIREANFSSRIESIFTGVGAVLPPKVRILAPSDPVVLLTSSGKLEIDAEADHSESNPVEALQLMVENRPYDGDKSRVRSGPMKVGKIAGRWKIEFSQPGNYRVYVRAEGKLSNGASNVILVNYTPKVETKLVRSKLHLLAIGVDDYPGDLKLKCAVNDARGIQARFEKYAGPLYDVKSHSLHNSEATRGRILDKLGLFQKDAEADDLVVIYYAGHGFRSADKQFYLQPYGGKMDQSETTCVSAKELRNAVVNIRSRKVVMIVDACHGGAPGELIRELADEGCGAGVLCAAADNEKAGERGEHGFFTLALMEALEGTSLPPMVKDRRVHLADVSGYVIRRVRELSDERQNPVCPVTRSFPLTKP